MWSETPVQSREIEVLVFLLRNEMQFDIPHVLCNRNIYWADTVIVFMSRHSAIVIEHSNHGQVLCCHSEMH